MTLSHHALGLLQLTIGCTLLAYFFVALMLPQTAFGAYWAPPSLLLQVCGTFGLLLLGGLALFTLLVLSLSILNKKIK